MKILLAIGFALVVAGCSTTEKIEVDTVVKEVKIPIQPQPKPIKLNDVEFFVVTPDNYLEFIENLEKKRGTTVYYAMTVPDYEIMALNFSEIKRYIEQQKQIILYYERMIEGSNEQPMEKNIEQNK